MRTEYYVTPQLIRDLGLLKSLKVSFWHGRTCDEWFLRVESSSKHDAVPETVYDTGYEGGTFTGELEVLKSIIAQLESAKEMADD